MVGDLARKPTTIGGEFVTFSCTRSRAIVSDESDNKLALLDSSYGLTDWRDTKPTDDTMYGVPSRDIFEDKDWFYLLFLGLFFRRKVFQL